MIAETMNPTSTANPIYETTLRGGTLWSKVIGRGKCLRITDLEGGANVATLFYNAYEKEERYNMPDTLKGQHVFFLTAPLCIHSDMGRLFCSIVKDSAGWHDTVCGVGNRSLIEKKYGMRSFQEARNDFHRNGRDCFLTELAKWGMGERDLVPNINFFSKVTADAEGNLHFDPSASKPGSHISLRMELDTLVVLNTCPHPLDPNPEYAPKPIKLEVFRAEPVSSLDPSLLSRPENLRAYQNTETYNSLRF
jgi:uncharacterized protein